MAGLQKGKWEVGKDGGGERAPFAFPSCNPDFLQSGNVKVWC
jgi:hypothetical protein